MPQLPGECEKHCKDWVTKQQCTCGLETFLTNSLELCMLESLQWITNRNGHWALRGQFCRWLAFFLWCSWVTETL